VAGYVERLLAAEALVVVSPIWNFGHPAILKGFMDRVFLPGVTFVIRDGRVQRGPLKLRRFAAVHTYGGPRHVAWWVGDPPRRVMMRVVGRLLAPNARRRYLALYDMNTATDAQRGAFLARVVREMEAF
jgi:putative NADPH-quinone reductase